MIEEKPEVTNAAGEVVTLSDLIAIYQTDPISGFHKLRYHVRENHRSLLRRIDARHGKTEIATIKRRTFIEWHMEWAAGDKISVAHTFVAQLRTLFGFGADELEDPECLRLCAVLHRLKFPHAPPRTAFLTYEQANAIRDAARAHFGWPSISLAQSLQFDLILRQKDVIFEWVPESEPGKSYIRLDGQKALRGLLWEEIDENLVLRHTTSKRQKMLEVDLKLAPMVVSEFNFLFPDCIIVDETGAVISFDRSMLPPRGPIVVCDVTAYPWTASEFRRKWRIVANHIGIPKNVRNMDSRAGGITEASRAGVSTEYIKHAATHSDIAQTQHYSRDAQEKIAETQRARAKHRNKFRNNS